jgi:hypothetical protein
MPTPTKAWIAGDGTLYPTAELACQRDLFNMFSEGYPGQTSESISALVALLVNNADLVVAALTSGPRSRPKARKAAGTTNPRRAARRATPVQATAGFTAMRQAAEQGSDGPVCSEAAMVGAGGAD